MLMTIINRSQQRIVSQSPCILLSTTYSRIRRLSASSKSVRILEVGPRDGLQNIREHVPKTTKLELIRRLFDTGLKNIEITSFVSPKWVPQLADNREVFAEVKQMTRDLDVSLPVLVPNMKGLGQAIASDAKDVVVFGSVSEAFSWKNTNCSIEEGLLRAEEVTKAALAQGDARSRPTLVLRVVKRFLAMGCYEVGLGDTVGVGTPADVERLLRVMLSEIPPNKLAGHFHDTYGQAIANVVKSYDMGIRAFDSSVAGLGGCPYAKGAKGNIATEDLIHTFEIAGVGTGVDLDRLAETGDWISKAINLSNNSRVGAAMVANAMTSSVQSTKSEVGDSPPKRKWEVFMDKGEFRASRSENAVKITLTRPKNGNALTTSMVEGITGLFQSLAKDSNVFHIVLEAEGKLFCTGMDLSSGGSSSSNDASEKASYYKKVRDLFIAIETALQTTIAAIEGSCFGGGVGLAFVCNLRVVSEKTTFTMTEIKLGLTPAIISRFLVREWGVSFLREAMLTGRQVSAAELQRIGTVHCISNDVEQAVEDYLTKLSKCAPKSAANCKELIQSAYSEPAGPILEDKIQRTFAVMMEPGSEGEYGLAQFRKKIKGGIDWGPFWAEKIVPKSKL